MAYSIIGAVYKDSPATVDDRSLTAGTYQTIAAASAAADSNAVGITAGGNISVRNVSGASKQVDGIVVFTARAFSSTALGFVSLGTSTDDGTYTEIDSSYRKGVNITTIPNGFIYTYSATVDDDEYIAPMFTWNSGTQTLQIYTFAHFVRTRDGENSKISAFSYTNQANTDSAITITDADTFYQASPTAVDDIIAGCTGNNDLSFDITTAATIDGFIFVSGRTDSSSGRQHQVAGGVDTGSGLAVASEIGSGLLESSSTGSIRNLCAWYTADVEPGDTVAPMVQCIGNTDDFDEFNMIHIIWSRN